MLHPEDIALARAKGERCLRSDTTRGDGRSSWQTVEKTFPRSLLAFCRETPKWKELILFQPTLRVWIMRYSVDNPDVPPTRSIFEASGQVANEVGEAELAQSDAEALFADFANWLNRQTIDDVEYS
jgi:hypothetical protein